MTSRPGHDSYKYQWARYVARKRLDEDIYLLKQKLAKGNIPGLPSIPNAESIKLRDIARDRAVTIGQPPKQDGEFKIGVVGAGCAGLFTGLIIDYLNEKSNDWENGKLNISYDILEAAGPERLGGRLYTYKFSGKKHDYYDVGAMRFPNNKIMERTFKLFDFIGINKTSEKAKLIPYYLQDRESPDGVCPSYYNDIRKVGTFKQYSGGYNDPFHVNEWLPQGDPRRIPEHLLRRDPTTVVDEIIKHFKEALQKDLDEKRDSKSSEGWDLLMHADFMSTREFFRVKNIPELADKEIKGAGLNFNTIEWLETFAYATGWYNQALSETVLESLDFDTPGKHDVGDKDDWFRIEGGTQQVATLMADKLKRSKPQFHRQVTAIKTDLEEGSIGLKIKHTDYPDHITEERKYFAVFNSTTLGALQRMDLTQADLNYGTKQAIRSLGYGASCKVGMKFKTAWWMKEPLNINRGGIGKTDLPLRVCVYPSYSVGDEKCEPAVLLCSYTWAQDAQRIGSLISSTSPTGENELKEVLFHNLALLHASDKLPYEKLLAIIKDQYITHHAYDWYHDPNMSGAFAYFGPGQFSDMWSQIIKPNGWLFLIGEAASAHHAWIVGALESSVRAVYQLLEQLELTQKHNPNFKGYSEAMKLLKDPSAEEAKLPFVGLPREMPIRQSGTEKGSELQDTPEKDVDLSFVAAQCIESFFELLAEIAQEKGGQEKLRGLKWL